MRAGPRHRELDQPEGRRGGLPGQGATDQAVRRRGRRDGVRRAGAGWHGRPQDRDQRARVPAADAGRRLRPVGHHLRSQHPGDRDRHGRAQRIREVVHRGDPRDQAPLPGREGVGRCVQPVVLVPRQRAGPSGDPLGVPLPRACRGPGHGHRERGPAPCVRRHPEGPAGTRRGHHLRPASGRDRADGDVRRDRQGWRRRPRAGPDVAGGSGARAALARARARHRRFHRGRHRGSAAAVRTSARGDRGSADGRHAHRRRSVRRREDVPAAGGEERARHEAGRRLPGAVHGGREADARRHRDRAGEDRARDREGGRARHREEHRGSRVGLQQLRGDRPGRHGARGHPAGHRPQGEVRHRRRLGPDHAVARRDGERRERDGAPRHGPARC